MSISSEWKNVESCTLVVCVEVEVKVEVNHSAVERGTYMCPSSTVITCVSKQATSQVIDETAELSG